MAVKQSEIIHGTEKEFLDIFHSLCYSRSSWQVWEYLISAIACSLSNITDKNPEKRKQREKEYERCIKEIGSVETASKMLAIIVMAYEANPDQDFLGKMYMQLNLGSHWHGQFFTPYNVCKMMAEMNFGDGTQAEVERKGYISVCDPACGAGATLIAAANSLKAAGINYQQNVVFVGQDIDRVVGQMCYIQLSLLGCPGYVVIANTITNPVCGSALEPIEKDGQEFWYTPFYMTDVWVLRRMFHKMNYLSQHAAVDAEKITEDKYTFFFQFDKEEVNCEYRN